MASPGAQPLSADERNLFSLRVDEFHREIQAGNPGDWERFLAGLAPRVRVAVLAELAILDLTHKWGRGEKPRVEDYLARFPELGPAETVPIALIVEEHRARLKAGESVNPHQYRERFPTRYTEILTALEATGGVRGGTIVMSGTPGYHPPGPAVSKPSVAVGASVSQQYERVRKLGEGAFAEVWEVVKWPSGIRKAMKVPFQPADGQSVKRELKALEAVKNLRHPCLLATEDFWVEDNRLNIVMELADATLRGRLQACREDGLPGIPPDELIGYLLSAAKGLDYLHNPSGAPRVIHRDVKPDNILILNGEAKVADFGLARQQDQSLAQQSMIAGTLLYMAPEVYGGDAGPASDQYGLAYAYVEARQGRSPLPPGRTLGEMLVTVQEGKFEFDALIGDAERAVLERALARRPEDRFASCTEFARETARALGYHLPGTVSQRVGVSDTRRAAPKTTTATKAGTGTHAAPTVRPGLTDTVIPGEAHAETRTFPGFPNPAANQSATSKSAGHSALRPPPVRGPGLKLPLAIGVMVALLGGIGVVVWALFGGGGGTVEPTRTMPTEPTDKGKPPDVNPNDGKGGPPVPRATVPPGAVAAPGAKEVPLADGRTVYDRLVFSVVGENAPFRLVAGPNAPVPPFYAGESKVWNQLYREAAREKRLDLRPGDGPGGPLAPVVDVNAEESERFARAVFGGHLPTPAEWDTLAGFFDQSGRAGPTLPGGQPRVGIATPAPTHGPDAGSDISANGLRDLAGNGREWTRAVFARPGEATRLVGDGPLSEGDLVITRGRSYQLARPLSYDILRSEQTVPQTQFGRVGSPYTSFRVVVPVPPR